HPPLGRAAVPVWVAGLVACGRAVPRPARGGGRAGDRARGGGRCPAVSRAAGRDRSCAGRRRAGQRVPPAVPAGPVRRDRDAGREHRRDHGAGLVRLGAGAGAGPDDRAGVRRGRLPRARSAAACRGDRRAAGRRAGHLRGAARGPAKLRLTPAGTRIPLARPTDHADPGIVLRADGVDFVRDGRLLLDQITVTIRAGEHWALLGPNGAGKTLLLRIMASYAHPTRGQVDILGCRLGRVNVFTLRPRIGHVTMHHPLVASRTVREIVLTGATGTIELVQRRTPEPAELTRAGALIDLMGLGSVTGSRWSVLSQGERSRTLIARALMPEPDLLLLDEPAAGLDVAGREQLLASI